MSKPIIDYSGARLTTKVTDSYKWQKLDKVCKQIRKRGITYAEYQTELYKKLENKRGV